MIPTSRKEMEKFVAEVSGGNLEINWLEQGQVPHRATADGNIYLEERELELVGSDIEEKLREFFSGMVLCGDKGVTLRGQGLQKTTPYDFNSNTSKPGGFVMAYAVF